MGAKVKLNMKGLRELVAPMVKETAGAIAGRAGEGFKSEISQGKTRPHGRVWADTREARTADAEENRLLKAMYGGG